MTEAELSLEERKHLYNMVAIVFLVTLVAFGFLMFFYLMPLGSLQTVWDFLLWYGVPYSIIGPTSFFLPYEVFYPKRVRRSHMFHAKRFVRRALSAIVVMLSFFAVTSISSVTFSKTLEDNAFWPGMVLWVFAFFAAIFLWLRRQNSRRESNL